LLKRSLLWLAGAAIIVAIGYGGYSYLTRLVPQSQYYHVALGATQHEVLYVLGYPTNVESDDKDASHEGWRLVTPADKLPTGKKAEDYLYWSWNLVADKFEPRLDITFDEQSKRVIEVRCYTKVGGCSKLMGIAAGADEDDVKARLGKPDFEGLEGVAKLLAYYRYNVVFELAKRKVYYFGIATRSAPEVQPATKKDSTQLPSSPPVAAKAPN